MWCSAVGCIVTLILSLLAAPLAADAQPAIKVYRIGWLRTGTPSGLDPIIEAFRQGLRDLGYIEGHNLAIEYRYAEGNLDRLRILAAELAALQPDVILTSGTPAVRAAQQATTTIPIVVGIAADLVVQGFVASLARPGGNITGLTQVIDLNAKRGELLKEAIPTIARVAYLMNPANPASAVGAPEAAAAYQALGIQGQRVEARHADDLDTAFRTIVASGVDALVIPQDGLFIREAPRIAAFALQHRLPTIAGDLGFAHAGGLMAYSASTPDMFRRAASYVDKILKGAKPADLARGASRQVRAGHQPEDRPGPRAHDTPDAPVPGGRGDPIRIA